MFLLAVLLASVLDLSLQINCRGRAICDVDITTAGSEYPGLIEIDAGTSIRFTNRVTKNGAEHTITPVKTSNAVNYFGGLSFYASDLGGLYTQTQVICGNVNCMDAFAVQRDANSPFLTKNWPEADYPYYCQFDGGSEKGIIRVGNGAGKEPPLPPNTDPDLVKKGCCAAPMLCAQQKPAGCADEWTVQQQSGLGYCEPSDANNCLAGGDGVCRWATAGTENCQIQGKKCLNGLCVEIDAGTPAPFGANPCGAPCTNYPPPECADATNLRYVADAASGTCVNVAGQFQCRYTKTILNCQTFGTGTTCASGRCVQNGNVKFTPPVVGGGSSSTPAPQGQPAATPAPGQGATPAPAAAGCSAASCSAPNQCVNNQCTACTANCASLQAACPCGVDCGCTSANCKPCAPSPTPAPTPDPNQPCSNAAPQGFCGAGQRCGIVGAAYACETIPPCSAAERERQCATPGLVCQGSNGVYQCGPRTPACSAANPTTGRCESSGNLKCTATGVCAASVGQPPAPACSLANPQGACTTAGHTCNTNAQGRVLCGAPTAAPGGAGTSTPACSITDAICKDACKMSAVQACSCAGVQCFPITADQIAAAPSLLIVERAVVLLLAAAASTLL